jgi:hypothetical protein
MPQTHASDDDVRTQDSLARDPLARRELLWLMAKLDDDQPRARELEGLDAGIRRRLAPLVSRCWHALHARNDGSTAGRELYARAWTERFAHHAARYRGVRCSCAQCRGPATGG